MAVLPVASSLQAQIRDSAGIRIVNNPAVSSMRPAFRLSAPPMLTLGGLQRNIDLEFRSPGAYVAAVRLSTGHVAVVDWDRIHLVDSAGNSIRIVGRRGSGPGEFQYLTGICRLRGDTLVVWDDGGRRAGIFTRTGRFVRHIPLALEAPSVGSCSSEGVILVTGVTSNPGHPSGLAGKARLIRSDGTQIGGVFSYDPGSLDAVGREPTLALAGRGVVLAEGNRWEVRGFDLNAVPRAIFRTADSPERLSSRDYDRLIEAMVPRQRNADAMRARLKDQRTSTHWPAYGRMLVDPTGCIWLEERVPPSDGKPVLTGRWFAFSRVGALLGYMHLPAPENDRRTELVRIDAGEAILRERDRDGGVKLLFRRVIALGHAVSC